jgi:putative ABC transport system substrate-binding protein
VGSVGAGLLISLVVVHAKSSSDLKTVGVLFGLGNDHDAEVRARAFEDGLRSYGWSTGQNPHIEYRYAAGSLELMQQFAAELVNLNCICILGQSTPVAAALHKATSRVPVVFVAVTDPIGGGLVATLAHPGGNVTGFTNMHATITGKYLSMLKQLVPELSRAAIVYNPDSAPGAGMLFLNPFVDAAKEFGIEPVIAQVHTPAEIETAMIALEGVRGSGLIVMPDNFTSLYRQQFVSLAARFRIPTIYPYRYFAEEGGLMSYGADPIAVFGQASDYVNRILRGADPADLPVQAPTKFELVINLKTARALGRVVPRILLAGADAVID